MEDGKHKRTTKTPTLTDPTTKEVAHTFEQKGTCLPNNSFHP